MVRGAGEWPVQKLAHQPCVLPDSPRWRALACLLSHRRPTSLQQPPRRGRAKASCVSGVVFVTLQDGHTLQESRGKRQKRRRSARRGGQGSPGAVRAVCAGQWAA